MGVLQLHLLSSNAFFRPNWPKNFIPSLDKLHPCKPCSPNHPSQLHCKDPNAEHQHEHAQCSKLGLLHLQRACMRCLQCIPMLVFNVAGIYNTLGRTKSRGTSTTCKPCFVVCYLMWNIQRNTCKLLRKKSAKTFVKASFAPNVIAAWLLLLVLLALLPAKPGSGFKVAAGFDAGSGRQELLEGFNQHCLASCM